VYISIGWVGEQGRGSGVGGAVAAGTERLMDSNNFRVLKFIDFALYGFQVT